MADDVDKLKDQNRALRRLVMVLIDLLKDVSVMGIDKQLHVSYICNGQWGYRCTCDVHQVIAAAEELLEEEVL